MEVHTVRVIDMPVVCLGFASPLVVGKELRSSFVTDDVPHVTGSLIRGEGLHHRELSNFRKVVKKLLLEGAIETFKKHSVREEDIQVIWVPGSFEIGVVAQKFGKSGNFHAILCIGVVDSLLMFGSFDIWDP
ncbi:hypothetical protein YC2023_058406 [Brassica napus]